MGQAKIHWDTANYAMVERIFRQSAEFCSENESWKLNVGHVFFMQEKYKECIRYYQPFVNKHSEKLLSVTAIVLANLCVAYIMTSANEDAEDVMRQIEKEEEESQLQSITFVSSILLLVLSIVLKVILSLAFHVLLNRLSHITANSA
eukprot:GHVS01099686.1.p1 GENE.GHVS01099686.1~~GHVS01099686.1.p1  ORF type:complete len:147 (+),score=12.31 GHVS01099686.1:368-808(+)